MPGSDSRASRLALTCANAQLWANLRPPNCWAIRDHCSGLVASTSKRKPRATQPGGATYLGRPAMVYLRPVGTVSVDRGLSNTSSPGASSRSTHATSSGRLVVGQYRNRSRRCAALTGTGRRVGVRCGMQPSPIRLADLVAEPLAELLADVGHSRPRQLQRLLVGQRAELETLNVAAPPGRNDRAGVMAWRDRGGCGRLRPRCVGPTPRSDANEAADPGQPASLTNK